jgi:hypothetical protein
MKMRTAGVDPRLFLFFGELKGGFAAGTSQGIPVSMQTGGA